MELKIFVLLTISVLALPLGLASGVSVEPQNTVQTSNNHTESQLALQTKLNDTVSKVIEAFEESSFPDDHPNQEHAKKGRIMARKGVDINATTGTVLTPEPISATAVLKSSEAQQQNVSLPQSSKVGIDSNNTIAVGTGNINKSNTTTPTATIHPNNASAVITSTSNVTAVETTTRKITSSSTTTTATTTTTTTTTTASTTTKFPKKPKITYSVDDEPKLIQAAKPGYDSPVLLTKLGTTAGVSDANGRLHVEEPLAELSKEYIPVAMIGPPAGHREFVIPVVTLIFAIPLLIGLFLLSYRRAKEFWLTRHYRRMDFLVDGMYNY
ncbi:uncharacterized protein LOC131425633 [Malaya genurostris]|uniref:uncharacterized protein LOC131425633 n=1 Tax=Malaya genurostris TaxID=325434 RepID=UPI0026F3FDF8|nr:uncharacterized protein LOC131425633 [Malaya genurostris]